MFRIVFRTALSAVLLVSFYTDVKADSPGGPRVVSATSFAGQPPGRFVNPHQSRPIYLVVDSASAAPGMPAQAAPSRVAPPAYPYLDAPMYSSPRQDVPVQVGGTAITSQFLAPQEMLYPHTYRALYAPYYYNVKGHWLWTPFGMESHDKWELQGTEVKVKYRSRFGLLSGFWPPLMR